MKKEQKNKEIHRFDYTISVASSSVIRLLKRVAKIHNLHTTGIDWVRDLKYDYKFAQRGEVKEIQTKIYPRNWSNAYIYIHIHILESGILCPYEGRITTKNGVLLEFVFSMHPSDEEQSIVIPSSALSFGMEEEFKIHPNFNVDKFVKLLNQL